MGWTYSLEVRGSWEVQIPTRAIHSFEISAPPAPNPSLTYTVSGKFSRRWRGLVSLPHMPRLRNEVADTSMPWLLQGWRKRPPCSSSVNNIQQHRVDSGSICPYNGPLLHLLSSCLWPMQEISCGLPLPGLLYCHPPARGVYECVWTHYYLSLVYLRLPTVRLSLTQVVAWTCWTLEL